MQTYRVRMDPSGIDIAVAEHSLSTATIGSLINQCVARECRNRCEDTFSAD